MAWYIEGREGELPGSQTEKQPLITSGRNDDDSMAIRQGLPDGSTSTHVDAIETLPTHQQPHVDTEDLRSLLLQIRNEDRISDDSTNTPPEGGKSPNDHQLESIVLAVAAAATAIGNAFGNKKKRGWGLPVSLAAIGLIGFGAYQYEDNPGTSTDTAPIDEPCSNENPLNCDFEVEDLSPPLVALQSQIGSSQGIAANQAPSETLADYQPEGAASMITIKPDGTPVITGPVVHWITTYVDPFTGTGYKIMLRESQGNGTFAADSALVRRFEKGEITPEDLKLFFETNNVLLTSSQDPDLEISIIGITGDELLYITNQSGGD